MPYIIVTDQEHDGRWIADVPSLRGVQAYGTTREEAISNVKELALAVIEDRIEHNESLPTHTGKKSFVVDNKHPKPIGPERLLDSLLRSGWRVKRETPLFKLLARDGSPDFVFAFENGDPIGVRFLERIVKKSGPLRDL